MEELVANFTLEDTPINAQFEVEEADSVDALFQINAYGYDKHFTYEQGIASDTWVINHNLNKHPSVTVVDTAGTVFTAEVDYNDENTCTVYINGATKGIAYLN